MNPIPMLPNVNQDLMSCAQSKRTIEKTYREKSVGNEVSKTDQSGQENSYLGNMFLAEFSKDEHTVEIPSVRESPYGDVSETKEF